MQFESKSKFVRVSPYKLRPYADVIRGKNVEQALNWLATCPVKKVIPIEKMLKSAAANAKHQNGIEVKELVISDIRVDEGPMFRYYKAGAMGRANIQRRRLCHMSVIVKKVTGKKD
jgi:large subunit ribosomal protein L22